MFSINEWVVQGKVVKNEAKKRGYFITVKGNAMNGSLYNSDTCTIDCWVSNKVLKEHRIGNCVRLRGRFKFEKGECYFITDKVLGGINE